MRLNKIFDDEDSKSLWKQIREVNTYIHKELEKPKPIVPELTKGFGKKVESPKVNVNNERNRLTKQLMGQN